MKSDFKKIPRSLTSNVPLAPLTTLGAGGAARFLVEAHTEEDVVEAISYAREQELPLFALGQGSNVLVPESGVNGIVVRVSLQEIMSEEDGEEVTIIAGAGALWEDVVDVANARGVFGITNLAGIPGSLGGAAVQNIGAYGAEFSEVFAYAEVIDKHTGALRRITKDEATFAYRTSFFKEHREYIILRIALVLAKETKPNTSYADLAHALDGSDVITPSELSSRVRTIRSGKFPNTKEEGTAGSFFKNPIVTHELAETLTLRFPGLPAFPQENGMMKLSLAWILDHVLSLKGYTRGSVRLYEKQPIVMVARTGATATDIDAFAREIQERVFAATNILIEREVETFGEK